jgi:hypothetical protein
MEIIGWVWWVVSGIASWLFALVWFLISGWVSTLLQIIVVVGVVWGKGADVVSRGSECLATASEMHDHSNH